MRYRESKQTSQQLDEIVLWNENLITLAERELAAFAGAVKELFGPEQARVSAAEWIDELESLSWTARPCIADFRRITTAASSRLAHRQLSSCFIQYKTDASQTWLQQRESPLCGIYPPRPCISTGPGSLYGNTSNIFVKKVTAQTPDECLDKQK